MDKSLSSSGDDLKTSLVLNHLTAICSCLFDCVFSDHEADVDADVFAAVVDALIKNLGVVKVHFPDRVQELNEALSELIPFSTSSWFKKLC